MLGSVLFATAIICKADMDLLVADTAIQFLKYNLSGRSGVTDKLLQLLEECYLKRRNGNQISGLGFLSRKPAAGSEAGFLKFLKDLHGCLQQLGEFAPVNYASPPHLSTLDITTDFTSFMVESSSIPNRSTMETYTKEEQPSTDLPIIG